MNKKGDKMIANVLNSLGITEWVMRGEPTNEAEFNEFFRKVTGSDSQNIGIESSNPSDFGVNWAEIQAEQHRLTAEFTANEYQRKRAKEYPSWQDQLDNIFHNGVDEWKSDIQAIKDNHPKP
jgi:hypothetical protein